MGPWGTPEETIQFSDERNEIFTAWVLLVTYEYNHLRKYLSMPNDFNLQ